MQTSRDNLSLKTLALAATGTFVALLTTGCSVSDERVIVGSYNAEAPCTTISLAMRADHTFVQIATDGFGHTMKTNVGHWSLKNGWVHFEPFLLFQYDPKGGLGSLSAQPERLPRGTTIGPELVRCPDGQLSKTDYIKPYW
jgi:hypothetical protein